VPPDRRKVEVRDKVAARVRDRLKAAQLRAVSGVVRWVKDQWARANGLADACADRVKVKAKVRDRANGKVKVRDNPKAVLKANLLKASLINNNRTSEKPLLGINLLPH